MVETFVIVKILKKKGWLKKVLILNENNEVMEFSEYEEANKIAKLFEFNCEKGWVYYVKKI